MAADILDRIHGLERFGSILGLDRLRELMRRLGDPQEGLKYIHIAGTNGKGSVCKFLEKGLNGCGYSVGTYISPYIEVFNERIQIDGEYISDDDLNRTGSRVLNEIDGMTEEGLTSPTEFEAVMAIAFMYFAEKKPDIVILETGLGGIGDATNIIRDPLACVITTISFDHMDVLGNTLEEIAANKAGIIKKGSPVVSNVKDRGAAGVISDKAAEEGCEMYDISALPFDAEEEAGSQKVSITLWGRVYNDVKIPMMGKHQAENLKTALAVMEVLDKKGAIKIDREGLYRGLEEAVNPGRFEIISRGHPTVVIDGAHNEAGAQALKDTATRLLKGKKILMAVGILKDKEVDKILEHMLSITDDFIASSPDNPRRLDESTLAKKLEIMGARVIDEAEDPAECVAKAMEAGKGYDAVIFAGSLYLIGDIRRILRDGNQQPS